MKPIFRRLFRIILPAAVFLVVTGLQALAATETVSLVKKNGVYQYSGNWKTTTEKPAPDVILHKINVIHAGRLVVSGYSEIKNIINGKTKSEKLGIRITLCDKNGRELETDYVNSSNKELINWAVNTGVYYLKVENERLYVIGAQYTKIADKNGTKKTKAVAVKKNKKTKGILGSGEKGSRKDWYKFRVSKARVLNMILEAKGTASVRFKLYGPSYPKGIVLGDLYNEAKRIQSVRGSSAAAVKKGIYYLCVTRTDKRKDISAYYQFKWY